MVLTRKIEIYVDEDDKEIKTQKWSYIRKLSDDVLFILMMSAFSVMVYILTSIIILIKRGY